MYATLFTNNKTWIKREVIIKFGLMIKLLEDEQISQFYQQYKY
jgi:hypothetical protein